MKPSHLKAKSSSPATRTSTEMSWCGRFLMSTASFAARRGSPPSTRTSSIRYSWTSSLPEKTFSTPDSISSGSIPDMKPTFPRFTPRSTCPGNILIALSIVPSPPRTKTRSGSVSPSGSLSGLTSEISTPRFSSAATSRSKYPSLTPGFATMPTQRTSPGSICSATPDDPLDVRFLQGARRAAHKVQGILPISGPAARDPRPRHADRAEPQGFEEAGHASNHRRVDLRVAHQPSATDQIGAYLELGLDEQDCLPKRGRSGDETS